MLKILLPIISKNLKEPLKKLCVCDHPRCNESQAYLEGTKDALSQKD